MTIIEYEKKLEELQNEINDLKKNLDKMREIPDYPFFDEEPAWRMNLMLRATNYGNASGVSNNDFNFFHTESFAKEFAEKCKMIAMLLHCKWYLCPNYVPNFKNETEDKWAVCYDYKLNTFRTFLWYNYWESQVCFDTEENAQKAASWMNEHF